MSSRPENRGNNDASQSKCQAGWDLTVDKGKPKDARPPPGASSIDLTNLPSSDEENEVKIIAVKPSQSKTTEKGKTPDKQFSAPPHEPVLPVVSNQKATPGNGRACLYTRARDAAIMGQKGFVNNTRQRSWPTVMPRFKTQVDSSKSTKNLPSSSQVKKEGMTTGSVKSPNKQHRASGAKQLGRSVTKMLASRGVKQQKGTDVGNGKVWETCHPNSLLKYRAYPKPWGYEYPVPEEAMSWSYRDPPELQSVGGAEINFGTEVPILEPVVLEKCPIKGHVGMTKNKKAHVNGMNAQSKMEARQQHDLGVGYIKQMLDQVNGDVDKLLRENIKLPPFPKGLKSFDSLDDLPPGLPRGSFLLGGLIVRHVRTFDAENTKPPALNAPTPAVNAAADIADSGTTVGSTEAAPTPPTPPTPVATSVAPADRENNLATSNRSSGDGDSVKSKVQTEGTSAAAAVNKKDDFMSPDTSGNKKQAGTKNAQASGQSSKPSGATGALAGSLVDSSNKKQAGTNKAKPSSQGNKPSAAPSQVSSRNQENEEKAGTTNALASAESTTPTVRTGAVAAGFAKSTDHKTPVTMAATKGTLPKSKAKSYWRSKSKSNKFEVIADASHGDGKVPDADRMTEFWVEHAPLMKRWYKLDEKGNKKNPYKPDFEMKWRYDPSDTPEKLPHFGKKPPPSHLVPCNVKFHQPDSDEEMNKAMDAFEARHNQHHCDGRELKSSQKELFAPPAVAEGVATMTAAPDAGCLKEDNSKQKGEIVQDEGMAVESKLQDVRAINEKKGEKMTRGAKSSNESEASSAGNSNRLSTSKVEGTKRGGEGVQAQAPTSKNTVATQAVEEGNRQSRISPGSVPNGHGNKLEGDARHQANARNQNVRENLIVEAGRNMKNQDTQIASEAEGAEGGNNNGGSTEIASEGSSNLLSTPPKRKDQGMKVGGDEEEPGGRNETGVPVQVAAGGDVHPQMHGPFGPDDLQTPPSSESSGSPPKVDRRKLKFAKHDGGPPMPLDLPDADPNGDGETDEEQGGGNDDDDDDDDDDDNNADGNRVQGNIRDNIDPERVREQRNHTSLVAAAVCREKEYLERLNERMDTLLGNMHTFGQSVGKVDKKVDDQSKLLENQSKLLGGIAEKIGVKKRGAVGDTSSDDDSIFGCSKGCAAKKAGAGKPKTAAKPRLNKSEKNIFVDSECAEEDAIDGDIESSDEDEQEHSEVARNKRKGVFDDSMSEGSSEMEFEGGKKKSTEGVAHDTTHSTRGAKFRKIMKTIYDDDEEEEEDDDEEKETGKDRDKDEDEDDDVADPSL